ncbi:MAG: glycerol-3-phosphate dehydrogenase/oxidase, partial [Chitinophagales bacterium]
YNKKNKVKGIRVVDHLNKQAFNIKGKVVVNAAGPWVDKVRQRDAFVKGKRLHLTKGVHVVVPYERLPLQQSAYFDVPGGRMMFAIPRANVTYIGTTDTTYSARIERPKVSKEDVDYILNGVNNLFPTVNLGKKDVISTWAGLRPLIHEDGKSPSELSRKDEIFFSKSGIISIAGGKLTGFRKMAERTVDEVMKALYKKNGKMPKDCITEGMCLSGGDFESASAIEDYIDTMATSLSVMNISRGQITDLVYKYGSNTPQILQNFRRQSSTEIAQKYNIAERLVIAELHYGIEHEMVHTSSDFFIRRTGRLYFERLDIPKYRALVGQILAQVFEWDEAQIAADEVEFDQEYLDVVNFI